MTLVLLVFAFVMFVLAGVPVGSPYWNRLIAWGLACWVATQIFTGLLPLVR